MTQLPAEQESVQAPVAPQARKHPPDEQARLQVPLLQVLWQFPLAQLQTPPGHAAAVRGPASMSGTTSPPLGATAVEAELPQADASRQSQGTTSRWGRGMRPQLPHWPLQWHWMQ